MAEDRVETDNPGVITSKMHGTHQAGEHADFDRVRYTAFFRHEFRSVVKFLIWYGADVDEATEAAQTAFTEAWRQWASIRDSRAWVRTVATRAFLRAVPVHAREHASDSIPDCPSRETPDYWIELQDSTQRVRSILDRLSPAQRLVMAWKIDGFGDEEIAKYTRSTPTAVRKNYARARQALKVMLVNEREEGQG